MMTSFTAGLSNLTDISASLNPLQSSGVVMFLRSLPTCHLSQLDLANTCTQQPLTEALEQPEVAEFFKQVNIIVQCHCECVAYLASLPGLSIMSFVEEQNIETSFAPLNAHVMETAWN